MTEFSFLDELTHYGSKNISIVLIQWILINNWYTISWVFWAVSSLSIYLFIFCFMNNAVAVFKSCV